jgi:hypothetical protein
MSDVEIIMEKLRLLGLEETKLLSKAVRDRLEELDDVRAYDEAKANDEETEPLEAVLTRFAAPPGA